MRRLNILCWASAVALAGLLTPRGAFAQDADTLSISGTFQTVDYVVHSSGIEYPGMLGADLAEVYANGYAHAWTLTLHGVTYSHDYEVGQWEDGESGAYGLFEEFHTHVHATSFDFEFFGPDAAILNEVVSSQLTSCNVELVNGEYFDSSTGEGNGPYATWGLGLFGSAGVTFSSHNWFGYSLFSADEDGYPLVEPQRIEPVYSLITDFRPGNRGGLFSGGLVDIGSSVPPVLPPPPPPPPTLSIADGFVREGNKATTRLLLQATLSRSMADVVTVTYVTANGTAQKKSDYTAASGTLTIPPGQTQGTISIAIKADRKRERDETFSVQLSNAVGATIADGVATATILNED